MRRILPLSRDLSQQVHRLMLLVAYD